MNPVAVTQPSSAHAGIPVQDWDLLYRAVLHRLNLAAGQAMDSTPKKYVPIAADRLPNTLSIRFPHARGSEVLASTPEVAASTGSACHAGGHESPSGVLLAMGLTSEKALQTVRLSVGSTTTEADVDIAAQALVRGWRRASGRA